MSSRVALVIGNWEYKENARSLMGPADDAYRMAKLFEKLDFNVLQPRINVDKGLMRAAIRQFAAALEEGGLAAFYYSGHGVQGPDGGNYLMPVDARLYEPEDVADRCYAVAAIIEKIAEKKCTGLLFLDACRDDPFRDIPGGERTKSVVIRQPGLAKVAKAELPDILVSYAANANMTALDGDAGKSSPYTCALLEYLPTPGVPVEELLKRVRKKVAETTRYSQQPVFDGQLVTSNLVLTPAAVPPGDAPPGAVGVEAKEPLVAISPADPESRMTRGGKRDARRRRGRRYRILRSRRSSFQSGLPATCLKTISHRRRRGQTGASSNRHSRHIQLRRRM